MKKIIAISGSNGRNSIHKKLIGYILKEFAENDIEYIDLETFDLPIYSPDIEKEGFPIQVKELFQIITSADGFIIASPEHNGLPTTFLKNHIDWLSRIDQRFFGDKPILLLSASPGKLGGSTHLNILERLMPNWGGKMVGRFSLGAFHKTFDIENNELIRLEDKLELKAVVHNLLNYHNQPNGRFRTQLEMDSFMDEIKHNLKSKGFI
jgi:NAD(P)H-dependent FMN reductase